MDLWNLDEESSKPGVSVTPIEETPVAADVAPNPSQTREISATSEEDDIPFAETETRVESSRSITVNAIDVSRQTSSESKYVLPTRMAVAPTEEEIWGDFVDDFEPAVSDQKEPALAEMEEEVLPVLTQPEPEPAKAAVATIITPERKKPGLTTSTATSKENTAPSAPEKPATDEALEDPTPIAAEAAESEISEPTPVTAEAPSFQITKFSRTEVIASLAFLLILIVGSFFVIRSYRANLTLEENPYAKPDYPVQGQNAEVTNVVTYWRAPIKEGPNPDPIKLDVKLLPVIEITLGSGASQGALRVMFHNEKGEIVGDTVTQNFAQGKFTLSDSATRAFSSTAGFIDFGEQEAYRTGQGKPWTIKVFEGPSDNASSEQFRPLFTTPIATERR